MAKRLKASYIQMPKKAGWQSIRLTWSTPKAPTSTVFPRKTAGGIVLNPKVWSRFPISKKRAK